MTRLRERFIEDMQLRGLATTTQRSYLHYTVDYAKFYNTIATFGQVTTFSSARQIQMASPKVEADG